MIVGRDTEKLGEEEICRACIESTAESFNDGFFAPLCFAYLGASPAAMGFKAASTMDSMLGYKTERFLNLGWAAAKTDDLLNFIPARLSCLVVALLSLRLADVLKICWRDAPKQPSPNSGWPEAAFAAALKVRLGGPSSYGGHIVEKAYLGDGARALDRSVVREALGLFRRCSWLSLILGEILWHWIRA
jgi:adenosylcobinamide-phosphate synthase